MYGTPVEVDLLGVSFVIIFFGLYLCRYTIKYLILSFVGLLLTLGVFVILMSGISANLQESHPTLYLFLAVLLPVLYIFFGGIILTRCGIFMYSSQP